MWVLLWNAKQVMVPATKHYEKKIKLVASSTFNSDFLSLRLLWPCRLRRTSSLHHDSQETLNFVFISQMFFSARLLRLTITCELWSSKLTALSHAPSFHTPLASSERKQLLCRLIKEAAWPSGLGYGAGVVMEVPGSSPHPATELDLFLVAQICSRWTLLIK